MISESLCWFCLLIFTAQRYAERGYAKIHYTPVSRSKSVTSWQLPRLQGSYEETGVVDFGLYATVCRLSVCLSVCPSVTFSYHDHIGWNT